MTYAFILISYLILFFVLSWRRIDWAVILILVTLPSYLIRFQIIGIPFTLLEAMILISFSVWFVKNYKQIVQNLKLKIDSKFKIQNSKLIRYPFDWEIVLVLVISFIAVGVAGFSDSALGIWKAYFFEPLLFYILIINVFSNSNIVIPSVARNPFEVSSLRDSSTSLHSGRNDKMRMIIYPLAISALGVSLVAIYQYITGDLIFNEFWANEESRRAVSVFGYPNAVGLYLAPIVMLMIGHVSSIIARRSSSDDVAIPGLLRFARNDGIKVLFLAVTVALSIRAIMFADSEGALVGLAAGLFVFGVLANKRLRWATIIISILIVAGIFSYGPIRTKAIDKITLMDLSGQIRKAQWSETWEMLKDGRLIAGSGLVNYKQSVAPYHAEGIFVRDPHDPDWHRKTVYNEKFRNSVWQPLEIYMYPHNIFLNFWVELGLAGMILFVWVIGKFFVIGFKNLPTGQADLDLRFKNKYLVLGLIGAMIVIVVHGLVDVPYFKNDLAAMFWMIVAMMGILNLESN